MLNGFVLTIASTAPPTRKVFCLLGLCQTWSLWELSVSGATIMNACRAKFVSQLMGARSSLCGELTWQAPIRRRFVASLPRSLLNSHLARMATPRLWWTPGRGLSSSSAGSKMAAPSCQLAPAAHLGNGQQTPPPGAQLCGGSRRAVGRRSARAEARQLRHPAPRQGFLKSRSVSARTEAAYRLAAREFQLWASARRLRTSTAALADIALEKFFDSSYFAGHNPARGRYTLYGLAFVKDWVVTKAIFPKASRSLRGWSALARERERWPMPWPAAVSIALHLAKTGKIDSARILLVQFDLYLRANEAVSLSWQQVTAPTPRIKPRVWAVRVAPSDEHAEGSKSDMDLARRGLGRRQPSKTGAFDQTVLVAQTASLQAGRGILGKLFEKWWRRRGAQQLLFSTPLPSYEADVTKAAAHLKFDNLRLSSHTARHGGASQDYFLSTRSIQEIQERGRRACEQSVRRYKKIGKYAEQLARLPSSCVNSLDANLSALEKML